MNNETSLLTEEMDVFSGSGFTLSEKNAADLREWRPRVRKFAGYAVNPCSAALKRGCDLLFAVTGIAVFFIPCIVIAACIWLSDRHTPLFSQERIGKGGRPFRLYKFRSMRIDAEADNRPALCSENDERLTKVGRFIRNHHLDEFPQLWNVLKGDMSFVGYRPERQYFIDRIMAVNPDYRYLFAMRPGLFSYATLYNGYTDTLAKMLRRLEMDLDYVEKQSLMVDFKIIATTAISIISGKKF